VRPNEVEISDSEGNFFQLSKKYCFDYPNNPNYAFQIKISDVNYYDYKKIYHTTIPQEDTIVLSNIVTLIKFSIESETPILTNDKIRYLQDFFSNKKNYYTSLSLEINIGKYDVSEFQNTIEKIYSMYLSKILSYRSFNQPIDFSISFKNDNSDNIIYSFDCN
jgi:hypothetical protein